MPLRAHAIAAAAALAAAGTDQAVAQAEVRASQPLAPVVIVGDAIAAPLAGRVGDASRGQAIVRDRETGNCLICHRIPEPSERFMGDLGPDLAGIGRRLTPAQLRLRLVDQSRINPATLMPPYYRIDRLTRVAPEYQGRPVLDAQAIEDVVMYLSRLTGD